LQFQARSGPTSIRLVQCARADNDYLTQESGDKDAADRSPPLRLSS
jgi:hypothetical protein